MNSKKQPDKIGRSLRGFGQLRRIDETRMLFGAPRLGDLALKFVAGGWLLVVQRGSTGRGILFKQEANERDASLRHLSLSALRRPH